MVNSIRPTVLVVESSNSNREVICECIEQLNDVEVLSAQSGVQALQIYEAKHPCLVLMEIALHDMDGLALTKEIRRRENSSDQFRPWTAVIFLSSLQDEEILAKGILSGGDDFLFKPVSEVVLLAKVRAMLRIVAMQQAIYRQHLQLREASILDGLTAIPNRRHFDETLSTEWKRCARAGSPISAILADVDFFKQFNDIYGHQAGDACLKAVANALNESLFRVEDMAARYGGEEFVIVLPGTDLEGAFAVAERMRTAIRELNIPHERGLAGQISCSFGVACMTPSPDNAAKDLIQEADNGLYSAKRSGRNRVCIPPA